MLRAGTLDAEEVPPAGRTAWPPTCGSCSFLGTAKHDVLAWPRRWACACRARPPFPPRTPARLRSAQEAGRQNRRAGSALGVTARQIIDRKGIEKRLPSSARAIGGSDPTSPCTSRPSPTRADCGEITMGRAGGAVRAPRRTWAKNETRPRRATCPTFHAAGGVPAVMHELLPLAARGRPDGDRPGRWPRTWPKAHAHRPAHHPPLAPDPWSAQGGLAVLRGKPGPRARRSPRPARDRPPPARLRRARRDASISEESGQPGPSSMGTVQARRSGGHPLRRGPRAGPGMREM